MIAVDFFNKNILRRCLDTDTFISIGNLNMMLYLMLASIAHSWNLTYHVTVISTEQVDTISSSDIRPTDGDLICLKIWNLVEYQIESRWINENKVMDRHIAAGDKSHQSSILTWVGDSFYVSLTIDRSFASGTKDFHIRSVFNDNCVSIKTSVWWENNQAIQLDCKSRTLVKYNPSLN